MGRRCDVLRRRCQILSGVLLIITACAAQADTIGRRQLREWARLLYSPDPQKRSSAATSLLSAQDESAIRILLETLNPNQPEAVRVSVITAFGVKGDDRGTAEIIKALDDPSESVRQAAKAALQSINTLPAIRLLVQAATDSKRPLMVRVQTIVILGDMRAMDAIPSLIELLTDKEETIRTAARGALERITFRAFPTVQEWLNWWEHSAKLSREEMLEELVALQNDRIRAMSGIIEKLYLAVLAERKDKSDPSALIAAMSESDSVKVKLYAIRELANLKGKAVTEALIRSLEDPDIAVQQASAEALGAQGDPSAAAPLVKALESAAAPVRAAAARALGTLKTKSAVAPLCVLLNDPASEVAAAAASALGELGDPAALDALIKCLATPTTPAVLYDAAANALAKMRDPRAVPALLQLLDSPKENVRWAAVDALGELRAREATRPLSPIALKDANPQVREAALAALAKIGDAAALDTLVEGLADGDKRVADQAMRALMQLAEADPKLYMPALDRLIAERRYTLAELVLAGAVDRLGKSPDGAVSAAALRSRMASGLTAAKEYARARPHLEALVSRSPKEAKYAKDLVACLTALDDHSAVLDVLARIRREIPAEAEYTWQETVRAVERLLASGAADRVVAIVDALEREWPELGGSTIGPRLREMRQQARSRSGGGERPAAPK